MVYEKEISFECIKELFYRVNFIFVDTIEPEYFRRKEFRVRSDPDELYICKDLRLLFVTCNFKNVQEICA